MSTGAQVCLQKFTLLCGACLVSREKLILRDPLSSKPFELKFFRYLPESSPQQKLSTVIIHPTGHGVTPNEGAFARSFCDRGLQSFIVKSFSGESDDSHDWNTENNYLIRGSFAIRSLAKLSFGPVGVLGFSGGGVLATLAAVQDKSFQVLVTVVAGAPYSEVLTKTTDRKSKRRREGRMQAENIFDSAHYSAKLKRHLLYDPANFLKSPPRHLQSLLVIAGRDKAIPTENQLKLWDLLGRPECIYEANQGHFMTVFLSFFKHGQRISDFFERALHPVEALNTELQKGP